MFRVIIFCDICNPQGVRFIEQTRNIQRSDTHGRRLTDDRAWFEGSVKEAVENGWSDKDDQHICPRCQDRHN